jgi:hypothetical protein
VSSLKNPVEAVGEESERLFIGRSELAGLIRDFDWARRRSARPIVGRKA